MINIIENPFDNQDFNTCFENIVNGLKNRGYNVTNNVKDFILLVAKHYKFNPGEMVNFFNCVYFNPNGDILFLNEEDFSYEVGKFAISELFLNDAKLVLYADPNLYQILIIFSRYNYQILAYYRNSKETHGNMILQIMRYLLYKEWVNKTHQYDKVELLLHDLMNNENLIDYCLTKGINLNNLDYDKIEYIIKNIDGFDNNPIIK